MLDTDPLEAPSRYDICIIAAPGMAVSMRHRRFTLRAGSAHFLQVRMATFRLRDFIRYPLDIARFHAQLATAEQMTLEQRRTVTQEYAQMERLLRNVDALLGWLRWLTVGVVVFAIAVIIASF